MKVKNYWTTDKHLVFIDDADYMHFIDLPKMADFLDRNNLLDWHYNVTDDLGTAQYKGKITFDQWLEEKERCCIDIVTYIESQKMINHIFNPINNILKRFKP